MHKLIAVAVLGAMLVGCGTTAHQQSAKPVVLSETDKLKKLEESRVRADYLKRFPKDADLEDLRAQQQLIGADMYMTWTGEIKSLTAPQVAPSAPRPSGRYETYNPGQYEALGTRKPLDIMK